MIYHFALLLQLCINMFETGSHCKVANASMQLIQGQNIPKDERLLLTDLNEAMMRIGRSCPILTCQWTYLLTLLGFDDMSFWSKVIGSSSSKSGNQLRVCTFYILLRSRYSLWERGKLIELIMYRNRSLSVIYLVIIEL